MKRADGRINVAVAIVVAGVGLFLWGFAHGSRTPDGAWVAAVAIVGAVVLLLATGVTSYRRRERENAAYTKRMEKGMKQDTSGAHHQDAVQ
jgi:multisubunit Na+/H+ antiporter MnhB subunit